MSIIKNHLQIELSIDQILYRLRLLRLNELQGVITQQPNRPKLELRSTSQLNVMIQPMMTTIDEEEKPRKRTEITTVDDNTNNKNRFHLVVNSSQSTPMVVALSDQIQIVHGSKKNKEKEKRRERSSTKRGLLMTKPE